jgi:hypothetical protein
MQPDIRLGVRVLVRWAGLPHVSPCERHPQRGLPLIQNVGTVDRIDEWRGDHRVVVVFRGIHVPPFDSLWVDAFPAGRAGTGAEMVARTG